MLKLVYNVTINRGRPFGLPCFLCRPAGALYGVGHAYPTRPCGVIERTSLRDWKTGEQPANAKWWIAKIFATREFAIE